MNGPVGTPFDFNANIFKIQKQKNCKGICFMIVLDTVL